LKRVFLFVLDSFGIGNAPDSRDFGDFGANTALSVSKSEKFKIDNMASLGFFNIDGVEGKKHPTPLGCFGRLMRCIPKFRRNIKKCRQQ